MILIQVDELIKLIATKDVFQRSSNWFICHLPGEVKQIIPKKGILKVIKNIL